MRTHQTNDNIKLHAKLAEQLENLHDTLRPTDAKTLDTGILCETLKY